MFIDKVEEYLTKYNVVPDKRKKMVNDLWNRVSADLNYLKNKYSVDLKVDKDGILVPMSVGDFHLIYVSDDASCYKVGFGTKDNEIATSLDEAEELLAKMIAELISSKQKAGYK